MLCFYRPRVSIDYGSYKVDQVNGSYLCLYFLNLSHLFQLFTAIVGAIFIDLTKAFDTVSHIVLLSKLSAYGIRGVELEWFTNYLFSRKQQVVIQNTKSECEFISCGMPQGSVLGPVLFLLYFNDFSKTLFKSEVLMFADNAVVFYVGKSAEEIKSVLNCERENIFRYFIKNYLIG